MPEPTPLHRNGHPASDPPASTTGTRDVVIVLLICATLVAIVWGIVAGVITHRRSHLDHTRECVELSDRTALSILMCGGNPNTEALR
jgi:hypothetical protein